MVIEITDLSPVGGWLRALIFNARRCLIAIVSHVHFDVLNLIDNIFELNDSVGVIVYSKLVGGCRKKMRLKFNRLSLFAEHHHYKYYLVDSSDYLIAAKGTANLTLSELNDVTLNAMDIVISKPIEAKNYYLFVKIAKVFQNLVPHYTTVCPSPCVNLVEMLLQ